MQHPSITVSYYLPIKFNWNTLPMWASCVVFLDIKWEPCLDVEKKITQFNPLYVKNLHLCILAVHRKLMCKCTNMADIFCTFEWKEILILKSNVISNISCHWHFLWKRSMQCMFSWKYMTLNCCHHLKYLFPLTNQLHLCSL